MNHHREKLNSCQLQRQIVSILKSASLKHEIEKSEYVFSETELLYIANRFARTYDERLHLFEIIKENASPGISQWAQDCIQWQKRTMELFTISEENIIYELHIKETPNSYDEQYLCSTFQTALNMIPKFYAEYENTETETARYHIEKRKIMNGTQTEEFEEDCLGDCYLLAGSVIESVCMYSCLNEKLCCGGICTDCKDPCVNTPLIRFPRFLKNKDPVRFEENDGRVRYGIAFEWEDKNPDDNVYIIPLDSSIICYHDFCNIHNTHEHIDAPFVEKVSLEELPKSLKKNYTAYAKYLQKHNL